MKRITLIIFLLFIGILGEGLAMKLSEDQPVVGLDKKEKIYLLKLARETIIHLLKYGEYPDTTPVSEKVQQKFGVFVTLHKDGQLRGCIGYVEGIKPLYEAVMEMAKSAAFRDPRFPAVSMDEVPDLEIEISVLSPLKKIKSIEEIKVGEHGLIIQRGFERGLLLPQVATQYGWNREQFLEQTCYKAGLPGDAWKDPETEIYIFTAEIFDEKELLGS